MICLKLRKIWHKNVFTMATITLGAMALFQNCAQDSPTARSDSQGSNLPNTSQASITETRSYSGSGGTTHNWTIVYRPATDSIIVTGSWNRPDQSFEVNSGLYEAISLGRGQTQTFSREGAYSISSASNYSHYLTEFQIRFATSGQVSIGHCSIQFQGDVVAVDRCAENGFSSHFDNVIF